MTVGFQRSPYAGVRALVATVLIMAGACGAHSWAGGHLPTWPYLVALAGVVFGAGVLALRGALSERLLLLLVLLIQIGLHESFAALASSDPRAHVGHPGHVMAESGSTWTWRMLTAHVLVTLLAAVVWRSCARAVVAVLALIEVGPRYAGGRRDPLRDQSRSSRPRELVWLVAAPRRGPPLVLSRA